MKKTSEHSIQSALIRWSRLSVKTYPELALLHSIPNGGFRSYKTAREMKAEGVLAGMPDLFLPVARKGFHGMYIEMKSRKGKLSESQKRIIPMLLEQGYNVLIANDWNVAAMEIIKYLNKKSSLK